MAERPEGWEARFYAMINAANQRGFNVKTWNCGTFAHACAEAIRGSPIIYQWKGSLEETADALLARVDVKLAQRGDIVLASVPEPSLGVCIGTHAVFVATSGLQLHPMRDATVAWRV